MKNKKRPPAEVERRRYELIEIERQELAYYKSMEAVANAAMAFFEPLYGHQLKGKNLDALFQAIKKIEYCSKQASTQTEK